MLCVGFAVQAQTDSTRLMIDSLTRELKEMKLKEMLMQEALEHSGETARMDSLRQAEQKQRIDSLRQTTPGVPLIIDGDTLLVVYASLGGESPVSRVESLQYKILQLGKSLKMTTDTTTGMPSPPLRIMAPSGAPMKKKIRQASERENFL
jgi:hypothetical protein